MAAATVIRSVAPAPVSTPKFCAAAPAVTAARFTPFEPIVTASTPAPPATLTPAKPLITFKSTAIVSFAASTVIPETGDVIEIVPAVSAVIVSTFDAALYDVLRSVIAVPAGSKPSTT
jgi:hypothetical protein